MKIATFNINGIKARIEALPRWLEAAKPDVVALQEIKSVDDAFPREMFEDLGWRVETHGQKSFNGVAILSRLPLEDVTRGLPGDDSDEQARWIEGKYGYKLGWMERMRARAAELLLGEEPVVLAGDYNVIPQAEDAARPEAWGQDALFLPESRAAFRRILNLGYTEAFRSRVSGPGHYSFWDYQAGAWDRNNGIRIDHLLLSPQAADLLRDVQIDRAVRGEDKPSDHVPVWIDLDA